jgi:hypothetical protein
MTIGVKKRTRLFFKAHNSAASPDEDWGFLFLSFPLCEAKELRKEHIN